MIYTEIIKNKKSVYLCSNTNNPKYLCGVRIKIIARHIAYPIWSYYTVSIVKITSNWSIGTYTAKASIWKQKFSDWKRVGSSRWHGIKSTIIMPTFAFEPSCRVTKPTTHLRTDPFLVLPSLSFICVNHFTQSFSITCLSRVIQAIISIRERYWLLSRNKKGNVNKPEP